MQKFIVETVIYAPSLFDVAGRLEDLFSGSLKDVMTRFTVRQLARKPPFEKPDTLYYAVRARKGRGRRLGAVTLLRRNGSWHRGIVICSGLDSFDGRYARRESYSRAMLASRSGRCSMPARIGSNHPGVELFMAAYMDLPGNRDHNLFEYKSEFAVTPAPYEEYLMRMRDGGSSAGKTNKEEGD